MNSTFNKKGLIENTVEVNIVYKRHRKRTEIDVIKEQKQNIILEMLWLACHNPEIDQKTGEIKITRFSEEYRKQQRPKQRKLYQQKQKEQEVRKERKYLKNLRKE